LSEDAENIKEFLATRSETAAKEIVSKYKKFVYLTILRLVQNTEEAKDITQEVFVKALNSLDKFRGDSSLKTWLYRISFNMATNKLRKQSFKNLFSISKDESFIELPSTESNPEESFAYSEFEKQFFKALAKLPKRQRETFALRYFDNLTYNEISEMLGISIGSLKANYFHAIKKLAEMLKEYKEHKE